MSGASSYRTILRVVVIALGWAIAAAAGAGWSLVVLNNPWGAINPIGVLVLLMFVGAIGVQMVRFGVILHTGLALVATIGAAVSFMLASYLAGPMLPGGGPDVWSRRLADGMTLFGNGTWRLKGGGLIAARVLEGVCIGAAGLLVAFENQSPYCGACGSWVRRRVWRLRFPDPFGPQLAALDGKSQPSSWVLMSRSPRPTGSTLVYDLMTCRCGVEGCVSITLTTKKKDQTSTRDIVDKRQVGPADALTLVVWGESVDLSLAAARPNIPLLRASAGPFEATLDRTEAGDVKSFLREQGSNATGDCVRDNTYTRALRERLLKTGDFRAIEHALRAQRTADDRSCVAEAACDWAMTPAWMERWSDEEPESPAMLLTRGMMGVKHAWAVRGGGMPKNVPQFVELITRAAADLQAAAELAPKDPTPRGWLVWTLTGEHPSAEEVREAFAEAVRLAPTFRYPHFATVMLLQERWFGGPGESVAFARERAAVLPEGASAHAALIWAHYLSSHDWNKSSEAPPSTKNWRTEQEEYFRRPEVARDILEAARKSVMSPKFRNGMDGPLVRSLAAYCLWKSGQHDAARGQVALLEPEGLWGPFGPNVPFSKSSLRRARKELAV